MGTWRPGRKSGWGESSEEVGFSRFTTILRAVMEIVPGGVIRAGKSAYTDDAHAGFWLGIDPADGLAKLNVGVSAFYVKWTGTRVEIAGSLTTKRGYVQIVDESTQDYGEGIRLLIDDWLTSGSLRWDDAAGIMGAVLAAAKNGAAGTHLSLQVYPRSAGGGAGFAGVGMLSMRAYTKPYGQVGADIAGWSISSVGSITGRGNLTFAQLNAEPACVFGLNSGYDVDALRIIDEDEKRLFIVEKDGGTYVNEKVGMTPEGGLAVRLVAGEALVRGEVVYVKIASGADGRVWKTVYSDSESIQMPVGIVYKSAAAGAPVWVVTGGVAYALPESGVTAARGNVVIVSDAESGRVEQSATVPTTEHRRECGHWLETGAGAGLAARLIVHFS